MYNFKMSRQAEGVRVRLFFDSVSLFGLNDIQSNSLIDTVRCRKHKI